MRHFKARLLAVMLILLSIGLIYYNWHQLLQDRQYSVKLAAFGPVVGIGGLFLMIFPLDGREAHNCKGKDHRPGSAGNRNGRRIS